MPGPDDGSDGREELAREAKPLRRLLVRYFSRRVPAGVEIDDLVQEVFLRIVARDSTSRIEHLGRYVHQTAASVVADLSRRRRARRAVDHVAFDPDRHGEHDIDPDRILEGKEDLGRLTAALLSLPERTRRIFILHRLEGMRCRDVAVELGISLSAVEKHMIRAIRHLAAAVEGSDDS